MKPFIESSQNPKIKGASRLRESRFRRKSGQILIDGLREIRAAAKSQIVFETIFFSPQHLPELMETLSFGPNDSPPQELLDAFQPVSQRLLDKISYGERDGQPVAIAQAPNVDLSRLQLAPNPLVLVLDRPEKPGNIGAVARTAFTAGASGLIVADPACEVFNPNAIRASLGTIFSLPMAVASGEECRIWMSAVPMQIHCARVDATDSMWSSDFRGPTALVLGSEAHGLGPEWTHLPNVRAVQIPMRPGADSLNLSVSAAVLCYEALRQRQP